MKEIIYCVSLPRTGTKSILKFLENIGYKSAHAPSCNHDILLGNYYNAFADTPCFDPRFISSLLWNGNNNRFIYIDRDIDGWINSWKSVGLISAYPDMVDSNIEKNLMSVVDLISYGNVFGYLGDNSENNLRKKFLEHKLIIKKMLHKFDLLIYNFSEGPEPILKWLNKPNDNIKMPHLNKNTMFE